MSASMSCQHARELFSDIVDGVLGVDDRQELDRHLAGCAGCRRELERFERTVNLLRQAEPVRAPAGFVDRVLAAAHPRPWWRSFAGRRVAPWTVQLPVKVAGAALVAIMAVYLSFGPRLSERAGHDRGTRPESPDAASLRPDAASGGEPRLSLPTLTGPPQESLDASREAHQRAQSPAPDASRPSSAAEGPRTAQRNLMKDDARLATPALQGVEVDGYLRGIAIGRGRVQVAELVARLGGTVLADRTEVGDAVIDIALPRARYDELARELAQLGQWSAVSRPVAARSPAAAERAGGDQMRILVRILE